MMPWREQAALLWRPARWVIWPPDMPLWAQLVYKIAQAVLFIATAAGAALFYAAGTVLAVAAFVMSWPAARP